MKRGMRDCETGPITHLLTGSERKPERGSGEGRVEQNGDGIRCHYVSRGEIRGFHPKFRNSGWENEEIGE